jgi:hypothetical protein
MSRGEIAERDALGFFEYTYRRAYTRLLALVASMYQHYESADGFFQTAERLVHDDVSARTPGTAPLGEIIAGLSDLREVTRSSTRVLTERLAAEAHRAQRTALSSPGGRPDLSPLRDSPLDDAEWRGWHLVTEPRLGLRWSGRGGRG